MSTLKSEGIFSGSGGLFSKMYEIKVRQQLVMGNEELLIFAIEGPQGCIRPHKEEMLIGPGFRDYMINIKVNDKSLIEKLAFRGITGWINASHMIASVREL